MGWDLYKPLDVWLGESQYKPFAFDVGTLGNLFRVHFWVRTRLFHAEFRLTPPTFAGGGANGPGPACTVQQNDDARPLTSFHCPGGAYILQGQHRVDD